MLKKETKENDRQDLCQFLGRLLSVLSQSSQSTAVSNVTIARAKQLLQAQPSENSVDAFKTAWDSMDRWKKEMHDVLVRCTDSEATQAVLRELTKNHQNTLEYMSSINNELKQEKTEENKLKDERHKIERERKRIVEESNRPTPGRPSPPTAPRRPREPGARASERDVRRYREDMLDYQRDLRDYNDDVATYPDRLLLGRLSIKRDVPIWPP